MRHGTLHINCLSYSRDEPAKPLQVSALHVTKPATGGVKFTMLQIENADFYVEHWQLVELRDQLNAIIQGSPFKCDFPGCEEEAVRTCECCQEEVKGCEEHVSKGGDVEGGEGPTGPYGAYAVPAVCWRGRCD